MKKTLIIIAASLLTTLQATAQASFGQAEPIADGWRFLLPGRMNPADTVPPTASMPTPRNAQAATDDSRWQHIQLPHDWGVTQPMSPDRGSCQGYLPGGIGWYRRHISLVERPLAEGEHLYVYFEGVYNRSSVWVNGHLLGYRPSGFSSFLYDLTPWIDRAGDNLLAVRADHSRQDDSRWYTGSGIYRPVWLIRAPAVHLALWGSAWRLKSIDKSKAVVEVDVETTTEPDAPTASTKTKRTAVVDIIDTQGKTVGSARTSIGAAEKRTVKVTIKNPRRWSLNAPYLYNVRTRLLTGSTESDRAEVPMGLRTLTFSPDHGFALNGEWMKVKGVCLHDDAGALGTAVPASVWKQRLTALKSLGVNAIRMSHNPHVPALYDLCDSLGMLVMDEASDEWEFPKRKWLKGWNQGTPGFQGTFDYFNEWIDRDVADMVRRDRCHPSIFLWSIGNEVDYPNDPYSHPVLDGTSITQPMYGGYKPEQPNAERIGRIAQRLSGVVRSIDDSRAVTGALAGVVMSNATAYPEAVDVVGYNYTESRYKEDHEKYPKRVIYGSENRHDLPAWKAVIQNEHIFGQFLWTGIDYLGESGPWPARGSEAGLLDLAGNIKPMGHYRASLWSENPVCYIGTYASGRPNQRNYRGREQREWVSPYAPALWNYDNGQRVRVVCYTNAASARLLLNGKPTGGEPRRDEATGILYWDIDYTPGSLLCEAIDAGGKVLSTSEIRTSGRPYALRATVDGIGADNVVRIIVEVVDEQGLTVPLADNDITCQTFGRSLRVLGMENGDIRDTSPATTRHRRARQGRLVVYLASDQSIAAILQQPAKKISDAIVLAIFTSPMLQSATLGNIR